MDSYATTPASIAEIRSDKTGLSTDWTPRDALIATLREIDNGTIKPDQIIIIWSDDSKGPRGESVTRPAGKYTKFTSLGLLVHALHHWMADT